MSWAKVFELWKEITGEDLLSNLDKNNKEDEAAKRSDISDKL